MDDAFCKGVDNNEPDDGPLQTLIPYRTDIIFRVAGRMLREQPVVMGILYLCLSYGGLYVIGFITGRLHGTDSIAPMYKFFVDNINLAFLAPVGFALLCRLYKTIQTTFLYLSTSGMIAKKDLPSYQEFLVRLDGLYNSKWATATAWGLSLAVNIYNYYNKTESWIGINGGAAGVYGRFFITVNYYGIFFILYKCVISVWALYHVLGYTLNIQPMHPDRCGGLQPIGKLSLSINYFLIVILFFVSLMLIFDPAASQNMVYLVAFLLLYALAPILLFASLARAYRAMSFTKTKALARLSVSFDHYYQRLTKGNSDAPFEIEAADEITRIYSLYEIVNNMPVWPYDFRNSFRFFSLAAIPIVSFIYSQINQPDGLLARLFYNP